MNEETPTPTARLPESPPGRSGKQAKTKGIGSIYQRGQKWWISYPVTGVRERESSQSENRADAVRLLKTGWVASDATNRLARRSTARRWTTCKRFCWTTMPLLGGGH